MRRMKREELGRNFLGALCCHLCGSGGGYWLLYLNSKGMWIIFEKKGRKAVVGAGKLL